MLEMKRQLEEQRQQMQREIQEMRKEQLHLQPREPVIIDRRITADQALCMLKNLEKPRNEQWSTCE